MNKEIKARIQATEAAEKQLLHKIRTIQNDLLQNGLASFAFVSDQEGKVRLNQANVKIAQRVTLRIERASQNHFKSLLKWLFGKLKRIFDLNINFFKAKQEIADPILLRLLLRYGFDLNTGKAIEGGYLSQIFNSSNIAARVSELIFQNLAAGIGLKQFRNTFKTIFVNPGGNGLIESQFNRISRDLFQGFDRETQNQFAEKLDLKYALYSGTSIRDTRDFCRKRVGNIYTSDEIDKWNMQRWQSKIKGVDVKVQCGGYNCRHHLAWISEEAALRIKQPNQYNTI